jgi:uncharacterized protein DUF5995
MVVAVAGALALSAAPASAAEPVYVPWTTLLPAMPGDAGTTGGPQPGCRKASMRCVNHTIRRMRRTQNRFGCDHRAVFATTYLMLTRVMKRTMKADPRFFRDRAGIIYQIALFSRIYFRTLKAYERGDPVDPAWQTALDNATKTDLQGSGDMLLGINAHVQNDMPFMLAAITLRDAKGRSRKDDHDAENRILDDAFDEVVREIARRYDPLTGLETQSISPASDVFGSELVKGWREGVWRNAERLVNAGSDEERASVAESIHQQAAVTADMIAAGTQGPPGYRAERDAYCATQRAR